MQRQTRRLAAVADASDVSQMDPWKDDRCRDFIALNTIQRLRSYHAEALLPVEPVNSIRAKNLILLPKAEPDARACETDEGCAIDTARILFFGPTAFTSLTSQGRMTASPHAGGHSSSRSSFPQSEEMQRSSPSKRVLQMASGPLSPQSHDFGQRRGEAPAVPGEGPAPGDGGGKPQETQHDAFEAGATPLRRPMNDTTTTPAPRPPVAATGEEVAACDEEHAHEREESHVNQPVTGVVKFSCAIVEAIVAYYQSLLTRGVVLDRFNAKDLAFAWWVVGRNMDVAALHHYTGPMRRDSLVILLRHFYYELLNEQQPKKSLVPDFAPPHAHGGREEKEKGQAAAAPHKLGEAKLGRKPTGADDDDDDDDDDDEEAKQQQHAAVAPAKVAGAGEAAAGLRKRSRSRLDPTRTSPPQMSSRLRRRLHAEEEASKAKANEKTQATAGAPATVEAVAVRGSRAKATSRQAPKLKEKAVAEAAVATHATAPAPASSSAAAALELTAQNKPQAAACGAGAEAPALERPHRSSRSANLEEVWRPIRSTRRRLPPSESSTDFAEAGAIVAEKRQDSVSLLNHIEKRIHARMTKDANYAELLTAFPARDSLLQAEAGGRNGCTNDENSEKKPLHGMHPALMQLLRYHHEPSSAPAAPHSEQGTGAEEGMAESGNTNEAEAAVKKEFLVVGEKHREKEEDAEGEQRFLACGREPSTARPQDAMTSSEPFVKAEPADEDGAPSQRHGLKEEGHTGGEPTAPLLQLPCHFSALTYPQRCLLTWEASFLLDPAPAPPVRRRPQPTLNTATSQSKSPTAQQRQYYDYWRNP
ncbi:uncharacterized protein Tco025E_07649 [Trypanosoma conorhini]|uniref:Uncharacterized protein n=1 Tax=Trypanosoma conorhini TaxID=83891 RepID=A0A422NL32_9TRYP|nr:uncharacterized protein Tco025E_07649 [Trypanosoma conorhini]RNF06173.1 hypothetical protein Tco025E_07649 [Trypanosoma conorhini]